MLTRYIELNAVCELIKEKTGIDLAEYEVYLPDTIQMRNKELFPFLKE